MDRANPVDHPAPAHSQHGRSVSLAHAWLHQWRSMAASETAVSEEDKRCYRCAYWRTHGTGLGDCELFETKNGDKVFKDAELMATATMSGQCIIVTAAGFGCIQYVDVESDGRE